MESLLNDSSKSRAVTNKFSPFLIIERKNMTRLSSSLLCFFIQMGCLYVLAQVIGAFMGYGLLIIVTPENILRPENKIGAAVGATMPHPDLTVMQAFAVEFIATGVLIFICCSVWDPRNEKYGDSTAIRFGLAITGLGLAAVSIILIFFS